MKRFFAIFFQVLTVLSLLGMLAWCGYCVWDHRQLTQTPGTSGIDFLMMGVGYGIGLAAFCIAGALFALIQSRLTDKPKVQLFDYITVGICLVGLVVAFILTFM